jgi:hypothetical protein
LILNLVIWICKLDLDLIIWLFVCAFMFWIYNFVLKEKRSKKYKFFFFLKKLKSAQKPAQNQCKPSPKLELKSGFKTTSY